VREGKGGLERRRKKVRGQKKVKRYSGKELGGVGGVVNRGKSKGGKRVMMRKNREGGKKTLRKEGAKRERGEAEGRERQKNQTKGVDDGTRGVEWGKENDRW